MSVFYKTGVRYTILILSLAFLAFSIYYFQAHIFEIGLKPYTNLSSEWMTGKTKFVLDVKKPSRVFLLHNARLAEGFVEFKIEGEDGKLIDKYRIVEDSFIKRNYDLNKGEYYCTISRDIKNNNEKFRFYYDRRFILQEYIVKDSNSSNTRSN